MTPLEQFQELPTETQKLLALECMEYLLSGVPSMSEDQDSEIAGQALDVALEHVLYDSPQRFALLSEKALSQLLAFSGSVRDSIEEQGG